MRLHEVRKRMPDGETVRVRPTPCVKHRAVSGCVRREKLVTGSLNFGLAPIDS